MGDTLTKFFTLTKSKGNLGNVIFFVFWEVVTIHDMDIMRRYYEDEDDVMSRTGGDES